MLNRCSYLSKIQVFIEGSLQSIPCFSIFCFQTCIWSIYLFHGQKAYVPSVSNKNWVPGNKTIQGTYLGSLNMECNHKFDFWWQCLPGAFQISLYIRQGIYILKLYFSLVRKHRKEHFHFQQLKLQTFFQ